MIYIKNARRAFENAPIASNALIDISDNFLTDFLTVARWCAVNMNVPEYFRKSFGMSDEPYGIKVEADASKESVVNVLVEHARDFCKQGGVHWEWLYQQMADTDSRLLLLTVLTYRALGWKYVPMPLDSDAFWETMRLLSDMEAKGESTQSLALSEPVNLKKINLRQIGYDVELFSEAFGIFNEFIYSQYEYRGKRNVYAPQNGDVVLDCGACFGGTSLYFADRVGATGKVISFEFFPDNITVFKENMRLNPQLSSHITLVPNPVWDDPGTWMSIEGKGPATQVYVKNPKEKRADSPDSWQVVSTSIDQTVADLKLKKVDYIKMDIEGAEMMALRGARNTIKKFQSRHLHFVSIINWLIFMSCLNLSTVLIRVIDFIFLIVQYTGMRVSFLQSQEMLLCQSKLNRRL